MEEEKTKTTKRAMRTPRVTKKVNTEEKPNRVVKKRTVKKSELTDNLDEIYYSLKLTDDDVMIPFSAKTGMGREDAWEAIKQICNI